MKIILNALVFSFLFLTSSFAQAQRLPCPPIECGSPDAPEGQNPADQEPSAPLDPVIEAPPPSVSDVFPKPPEGNGNNQGAPQNDVSTVNPPPAPKPPPVVIMDEPYTSIETVVVNPSADKPKPVVIAIDKDGKAVLTDDARAAALSQEAREQAQFRNETLEQFNLGQDLTGSAFALLEQAAFLMTPEGGTPATKERNFGFFKIPGMPAITQQEMVDGLLQRAQDGDEEAIGELMAGMMQVGIDLANKPESQLTQAEQNFVTWLEQRIQNIRIEVARNTQNQWNQYVEENSVNTGMSQLLANAVDPSGFDPQIQMNFENPNSQVVNAITGTFGGVAGGVAAGAAAASASIGGSLAKSGTLATALATGSTAVATVVVVPVIVGTAAAASLAYQIYKTAAFEEYNKAVEDAVTAAQQPVDLQSLANGENGDQVIANALALVMLNNAGATSYTADGVAAALP